MEASAMADPQPIPAKIGRAGLVLLALGMLGILVLCPLAGDALYAMLYRSRVYFQEETLALGLVAVPTLIVLGLSLLFLIRICGSPIQGTDGMLPPLRPKWLRAGWSLLAFVLGGAIVNGIAWGSFFALVPVPDMRRVTENFPLEAELFLWSAAATIAGGLLLAGIVWWKRNIGPRLALVLVVLTIVMILCYGLFGIWLRTHGVL